MKKQNSVLEKVGFSFPVQVLKYAEDAGDFHIVGYAATTDFDLQGDVISEEALKASVADLLTNSTVLLNHDMESPIGKVTKVQFDRHGLLIDALISRTEPEIIQKIKEGVLNKFSIRGQVLDRDRSFSPEHNRMVNVINRMSLIEVSLVSVPANPEAKAIGWYLAKALNQPQAEGVTPMPENVTAEKVTPEGPKGPTPAQPPTPQAAPKEEAKQPAPETPIAPNGPPTNEPNAFTKVQDEKPAEVQKDVMGLMKSQLEPIFMLLEKVITLGGEAGIISQQIKTMLKKIVGEPMPSTPPPSGMSKGEIERHIATEVQKQLETHLKALPPLRKGLIQPDADADELRKKFENLTPEQKLRAALAFRETK